MLAIQTLKFMYQMVIILDAEEQFIILLILIQD